MKTGQASGGKLPQKKRIALLDLIRGIAIILMVIYHMLFTFGYVLDFNLFKIIFDFFEKTFLVSLFAGLFIMISGISSSFSKSNVKRGLKTMGAALLVSFVTAIILPLMGYEKLEIYFGILHFLAVAMLLSPLLMKLADKIPAYIGIPAAIILFLLTRNISQGYIGLTAQLSFTLPDVLRNSPFLFPLGIVEKGLSSSDYFPVFPWIFIFYVGIYLGKKIERSTLPERFYKTINAPIEWVGRHTLIIYMAHQPVIFLYGLIIEKIVALFK